MKVMIILAHPLAGSFNHAVAERARRVLAGRGHQALFHDLYAEGFDPVLTAQEIRRGVSFDEQVLRYTAELDESGGLVLIHPDWWSQPPALLKGWVDRVFRPGVAYEFTGEEFLLKRKVPLFAGKKGMIFATTHARPGSGPPMLEEFWLRHVFRYCGIEEAACHILYDMYRLDRLARIRWLDSVEQALGKLF
jgi:putative NADPH-quinone reductase